jgi:hypothetical protein
LAAVTLAIAPAYAQDKKDEKKADKPTAEQCKKDPKIKGCDEVLKKQTAKKPKSGGC